MRLTKITALAAVATFAAAVAMASPAQAATQHNGIVEAGEIGLYYSQGSNGSWVFDIYNADYNFSGNVFPGTNVSVDNNTASFRNRTNQAWVVWTGANQTGNLYCLPYGIGNFDTSTRNTISGAQPGSAYCL